MAIVKVPVKAFLVYVNDEGRDSVYSLTAASIALDGNGTPQAINTDNGALALVCSDLAFTRDAAAVFQAITKGAPR